MFKKTMIFLLVVAMTVPTLFIGAFGESVEKPAFDADAEHYYIGVSDETGVLGMRVSINAPVCAVSFCMPTNSVSGKFSANLSVYRWEKDLTTTMSVSPLATHRFTALVDNAVNKLMFDEISSGEYFFCIEKTDGNVGCWARHDNKVSLGFAYSETREIEAELEMYLTFTDSADSCFSEVESIYDSFGDAPKYDEITDDQTDLSGYNLEESLYLKNDVMPDTWVFTDSLGRKALTAKDVGPVRDDKTLALFYWTWHKGQGEGRTPFNNQQFLDKLVSEGVDLSTVVNNYDYEGWPVGNYHHFWDEPIYGYYKTNDKWVLRKQSEMLSNAMVDTIFTDNTNGQMTWRDSYIPLYETWSKAQKDGVLTPKVSFMLPFWSSDDAIAQMEMLYSDIYRPGKYRSLWYTLDKKPMLMAWQSSLDESKNLHKEIASFFTFRNNYSGYINKDPQYLQWSWLSVYPQTVYYKNLIDKWQNNPEQVAVGVAQNHNYVTKQLCAMNGENITGRTYTSKGYDTRENAVLYGANFEEQFKFALDVDPQVIFVTGWNEWIAGRYEEWQGVKNAFPDQYNAENSRDIEPSRGVLGDAYYYQFVNFVRQYKGVRENPLPGLKKTIDIKKDASQWSDVTPYFASYIGNTGDREAEGYGDLYYTDYSGRNDIIGTQMARDDDNIYILVECADDITPYTDKLWMNIYLDTDRTNEGFESFDYVINKKTPESDSITTLERFTGNGYESETVAKINYSVDGRYLQVCVPKELLGISGYDFTVDYCITDNVHDESDGKFTTDSDYEYSVFSGDILNFYTSGDVAPGGRFKYRYESTEEYSVEIKNLPKTEYYYRESFDSNGLVVSVTYSDGTSEELTDGFTLSGTENLKYGENEITVTKGAKSASFTVEVKYKWWQWIIVILLFGWLWY
ncbi:MAG: bacterial Ig-like domain-containing protein [Clostridia bacterium]|nr:bacterial Ig-like domain-containing protein [Clostridia bacterium]